MCQEFTEHVRSWPGEALAAWFPWSDAGSPALAALFWLCPRGDGARVWTSSLPEKHAHARGVPVLPPRLSLQAEDGGGVDLCDHLAEEVLPEHSGVCWPVYLGWKWKCRRCY